MTTSAIVLLALKASLALTVFGVGLSSARGDATYLFRHPGLFGRTFIAMSVIMPLLVLLLTTVFSLSAPVTLALIALALSPVPPFLPGKVARAGGDASYVVGLFVAASLLALVVVPLSVSLFGDAFGVPLRVSPSAVARLVGTSVLVPIALGIAGRELFPSIAARAARPVGLVATVMLLASFIPLLVAFWPAMRSLIGNGTLVAIVVITVVGLGIGHLLGGPRDDDRTVLSLATATRHPAIAIAIATANFPSEKMPATAAVLLALIVGAVASLPYMAWSKRHNATRARAGLTHTPHTSTSRG